jgi:two-component sensor histidine kinase
LQWSISTSDQRRYLNFQWQESGGPPVLHKGSRGFGLSLIAAMGRSLTTEPNIQFHPHGLECRMRVPLDTLTPDPSQTAIAV